jgi:hypothetical protein
MTDKTARIGEIVQVMLNTWDMPPDCNEGELFTYAETLYDRIVAGDSKEDLYAYLSEVQVEQLEIRCVQGDCRPRLRTLKGPDLSACTVCRNAEAPGSTSSERGAVRRRSPPELISRRFP